MSYSISTLLTRNLHDVFGENDPARRRAAIDEIFTENCVFYDPKGGVYRGRDEIDRIAGAVKATHPDLVFGGISSRRIISGSGHRIWKCAGSGRAIRLNPSRTALTVVTSLSGSPEWTLPLSWPST